jgi:hypothetical protein
VELSRRRDKLTWSHHLEVAPLEPATQVEWLDRAEEGDNGKQTAHPAGGYQPLQLFTAP